MILDRTFSLVVDGCIRVDEPCARDIGFTSDKWNEGSYLWRDGREIKCSFLLARNPGSGAFSALVAAIRAKGLVVAVPCPLGHMESILRRWGWRPTTERTELGDDVDVWRAVV